MKRSFFQAAVTSILLYGCTTWTLTKRLEKKLDGNYGRMLRAILNKSWRQHPTRHQLYGHLPPITKTIQVRRTRHAGHCWRSRDELIRDVLLWTPTLGRAKAGRPARTYIQQLCEDTGCCPEDLPGTMNDREEWRERVRDIRATSTTWWWWYIYIYIERERERRWEIDKNKEKYTRVSFFIYINFSNADISICIRVSSFPNFQKTMKKKNHLHYVTVKIKFLGSFANEVLYLKKQSNQLYQSRFFFFFHILSFSFPLP